MDTELTKSLTALIDETLQELEELKKSRFQASEIKLEGPGKDLAGKPTNGSLEKEEDEEEAKKAEEPSHDDDPADSESTKRKLKGILGKGEDENEDEEDEDEMDKAEDMDKAESDDEEDEEDEEDEDEMEKAEEEKAMKKKSYKKSEKEQMEKEEWKKSVEESSTLLKSLVDERIKPIEEQLSNIFDLINKIADQPVAPKGVQAKAVPLMKSEEFSAAELLTKSQVASKLFELKKSGKSVDSLDVTKAEMGQDLETIVKKYNIS